MYVVITMSAKSDMTLKQYTVKKLYFEMNESFDFKNPVNIRINPDFKRDIVGIDENQYKVNLKVKICKQAQKEDIPFFAEVCIEGIFHFENWESQDKVFISRNNSTAILFPYLRSLLSTVTTTGNLPPYFLPIMYVAKLFAEQEYNLK